MVLHYCRLYLSGQDNLRNDKNPERTSCLCHLIVSSHPPWPWCHSKLFFYQRAFRQIEKRNRKSVSCRPPRFILSFYWEKKLHVPLYNSNLLLLQLLIIKWNGIDAYFIHSWAKLLRKIIAIVIGTEEIFSGTIALKLFLYVLIYLPSCTTFVTFHQ